MKNNKTQGKFYKKPYLRCIYDYIQVYIGALFYVLETIKKAGCSPQILLGQVACVHLYRQAHNTDNDDDITVLCELFAKMFMVHAVKRMCVCTSSYIGCESYILYVYEYMYKVAYKSIMHKPLCISGSSSWMCAWVRCIRKTTTNMRQEKIVNFH